MRVTRRGEHYADRIIKALDFWQERPTALTGNSGHLLDGEFDEPSLSWSATPYDAEEVPGVEPHFKDQGSDFSDCNNRAAWHTAVKPAPLEKPRKRATKPKDMYSWMKKKPAPPDTRTKWQDICGGSVAAWKEHARAKASIG